MVFRHVNNALNTMDQPIKTKADQITYELKTKFDDLIKALNQAQQPMQAQGAPINLPPPPTRGGRPRTRGHHHIIKHRRRKTFRRQLRPKVPFAGK